MRASFRVLTGPTAAAVAVVEIVSSDLDAWLEHAEIGPVTPGRVELRDLCGIDRGLVVRWSPTCAHLMPHGGRAILAALRHRLVSMGAGLACGGAPDTPEAKDVIEHRMLDALARAASPRAVDLLLAQPARWRATRADPERGLTDRDAVLRRLIDPPLVVVWGPANIGKSSLTNALAQRMVSIVADEPGTTRDHVGVTLELDGLVVRYIDTPGVRSDAGRRGDDEQVEHQASLVAANLASKADLLLLCGDRDKPPVALPAASTREILRVALRTDLGTATWPHDVAVCAPRGEGLGALSAAIREALVPDHALDDPREWRFWP